MRGNAVSCVPPRVHLEDKGEDLRNPRSNASLGGFYDRTVRGIGS